MTTLQKDILDNNKYTPVLDYGFVGLVDHMGSDQAIEEAARLSYGKGTKHVSNTRGLLRYLMRHRHTSPFEMCEVKLHIKCPIFVIRQLVRHRTHSMNEYSGRYSTMSDEMYMPDLDVIKPQSQSNKQGRDGELSETNKKGAAWIMDASFDHARRAYKYLGTPASEIDEGVDDFYGAYSDPSDPLFDSEFPGISRELARIVLPVAGYTEFVWKQDLHNMLHLLSLRRDSHAQYEIRVYAEAIYNILKDLFPITIEAWEDYSWNAKHFSRMEMDLMFKIIDDTRGAFTLAFEDLLEKSGGEGELAKAYGMSAREMREFIEKMKLGKD